MCVATVALVEPWMERRMRPHSQIRLELETKAIGGTWRLPELGCLLDCTSFSLGSFTSLRICYLNLLSVSE